MRPRLGLVVVLLVIVLAGCSSAPVQDTVTNSSTTTTESPVTTTTADKTSSSTPTTTTTSSATEMVESHQDPANDTLGWEDGYWHNESIDVNRSDGLNESELDAVVARSMARVEYVRELEFEERVPVKIISREEFRNETEERFQGQTEAQRLHQDVKFEALFFLGEDESAITQQQENTASNVLGYYSPANHSIKIVSDNPESLEMNEITLSQELFHAVQEKTFNTSELTANTEELHNARDGIIEGDGNYVDHRYEQLCDGSWECLMPQEETGGGSSGADSTHVGMLALRLQPYSDGPVFVQDRYEESGWQAVNAVYDDAPESTEQTIHSEKYGVDSPQNVSIEDRSTSEWYVPDQGAGSIDYAQFGEAGVYVMLWYPSFAESQAVGSPQTVIIPVNHFLRPSRADTLDLYNYSHPYSAGWDGDKLLPYVTNESAETNETGYVWKLVWDSEADAQEFADAYRQLLVHHGAEPVAEHPDTYRIEDGKFADAFRLELDGETVKIVNAPSVSELDGVHDESG